jgi:hypothetical protein
MFNRGVVGGLMKRSAVVFLVTVVLFTSFTGSFDPASAELEGIPVSAGIPPNLLPKGVTLGSLILNPILQIGYQRVSATMSYPLLLETVVPVDDQLEIGTMELSLKDVGFWSATAGVNAVISPAWSVFANITGYFPVTYPIVTTLPIRLGGVTLPTEIIFTGTKTEYWLFQLGGSLNLSENYSVILGCLWDRFQNLAVDPRIGSTPLPDQTLRGDFWEKTIAPFAGFQVRQNGFSGTLIYSPYASTRSIMAIRDSAVGLGELAYNFNKPGQLISFTGQYDVISSKSPFSFQIWGNASWMAIRGAGDFTYTRTDPFAVNFSRSRIDAISAKYVLGGGVTWGFVF